MSGLSQAVWMQDDFSFHGKTQHSSKLCFPVYDEGASWLNLLLLISKHPESGSTILQSSALLFLFYLHFTVTTWVIMTCYSHCLSADKSKDLSSSSI